MADVGSNYAGTMYMDNLRFIKELPASKAPTSGNTSYTVTTSQNTATATATATATPTATPVSTAKPSAVDLPSTPKPAIGISHIGNHWAKGSINQLLSKGIINGYSDGTIKPNKKISRVEFTVVIAKALGLKPSPNPKVDFADSNKIPSWAIGYIAIAKEKGIIKGNADNAFLPNNGCNRDEAIVILSRAFNIAVSKNKLTFKDAKAIPSWSYGYIAKATELGLIKGYSDNSFKPGNSITRAEMFTILSKCLK